MENKVIHYCWFGDKPLPKLAKKCIKSWKKYLPQYEIVCWNEKNFDVNCTPFSKDAYEKGKWAFVSDVCRAYALKEMGGVYFDTDMMITKNVDDIMESEFFAAWESELSVAVGVLGVSQRHHPVIEKLYAYYESHELNTEDLFTQSIPRLLTNILRSDYNLQNDHLNVQRLGDGIVIYPREYFYPIGSDNTPDMFTEKTCMVHYYMGSWLPREQRIRNKVHNMMGERFGDVFLDFAVSFKKTLRMTGRLVLYPLVKTRRDKIMKGNMLAELENYKKEWAETDFEDYVVFYHKDWLGTSIATKELFDNTFGLRDLSEKECIDFLAEKIVAKKFRLVAFSAFADGWEKLVRAIRAKDKNVIIKIIWHGSNCMNIEDYDWKMFESLFSMLNTGVIQKIAFVKKSMYEFYKKKGYDVEFLMNTLSLDRTKYVTEVMEKDEKTKIGVYASGDRWVKNFYNQLCAASLVENAKVECTPLVMKTLQFAEIIKLEIEGQGKPMPREELLKKMAHNDLNLYVTFTECAPLIPLESLELGVPCITANNHHYWEGTELAEYLIVDAVDDVNKIHEKIEKCLSNREKIMQLYREWKREYDIEAEKSLKHFMEIEG